jgi:cob(I)alamin adenosyltransferase
MGNRLSKIVTRTGDAGTTGLGDGSRVGKDSLRIDAMGEVDELNSCSAGAAFAEDRGTTSRRTHRIQHDLFDCGGEMAIPGYVAVTETQVERLDGWIEVHNAPLSPLKEFILPGGVRSAALAHLARTTCRRAERSVVALARAEAETKPVNPLTLQY